MATSLAAQLAARTTLDSTRLSSSQSLKHPPSFIYSPRYAASLTTSQIADTAASACDTLASLDPFFDRVHSRLFSEQARTTDRSSLTPEENKKLDLTLNRVLRHLSPHLLLKPAGVLLEWLVRRFRVHDLNVPALVALFMPYHTTTHFASLLALISLPTLTQHFPLLVPCKSTLAPLPQPSLLSMLSHPSSRPFLEFLLSLPQSYLDHSEPVPRVVSSFWLQFTASHLERYSPLSAGDRALVLSTVLNVLRYASQNSDRDALVASYVLTARIVSLNPFQGAKEVSTVLKAIAGSRIEGEIEVEEAWITTLVVVSGLAGEGIKIEEGKSFLGTVGWKSLLRLRNLKERLLRLSNEYDARGFMKPFLETLTLQSSSSALCQTLLLTFVDPAFPTAILDILVHASLNTPTPSPAVLQKIYQRFPASWSKATSTLSPDVLSEILPLVLGDLACRLQDPDRTTRLDAFKRLLDGPDSEEIDDQALVHDTIVSMLHEQDDEMLSLVLETTKGRDALHRFLEPSEIAACLSQQGSNKIVVEYYSKSFPASAATPATGGEGTTSDERTEFFWSRLLASKSAAGAEFTQAPGAWFKGIKKATDQQGNVALVERLAKNMAGDITGIDFLLAKLAGGKDVLSLLVLSKLALTPADAVRVLSTLNIASLDEVSVGSGEVDAQAAVWTHLTSSVDRVIKIARSALLVSLSLVRSEELNLSIYRLAHTGTTTPSKKLGAEILSTLFTKTIEDSALIFLASVWTSAEEEVLRMVALREGAVWAQACGKQRDWQVLGPAVVAALQDGEKKVREEALALVKVLRRLQASEVYQKSPSKNVVHLDTADFASYLDKLLASATEIALDPSFLATVHSSLLDPAETKKKHSLKHKVVPYLLSHVTSIDSSATKIKVLQSVEGITEGWKGALVVPLLENVVTSKEQVDEEYARLLLAPYRGTTRKWLEATEGSLDIFWKALETEGPLRKAALAIVKVSFFALLKGEFKLDLFKRVVRLASDNDADALAALRSVSVDSETLASFLAETKSSFASPVSKGAKRGRTSISTGSAGRSERVPELVVVLESVNVENVVPTHTLVLGLFDLLSSLIEMASSAQLDIQYPGQLLLSTLAAVIKNVKPDSGITTHSIRMSPVLDFMRATANPQTSQQALLLLAQLGPLVPDQLVHNVMPIFTLMGANVLQRDDAYSLRVVEQTIESIVPALVKSMKKSSSGRDGLVSDLKELIQVFTDAAAHVPRHRRVQLFVRFVEKLGPREFLSAVAMLLADSDSSSDGRSLPLSVLENFSVDAQLLAFTQIATEVTTLLQRQEEGAAVPVLTPSSDEEAQDQVETLISLLTSALEVRQLGAKIDSARAAGVDTVDAALSGLVRALLDIAALPEASADLAISSNSAVHAAVKLMSAQSLSEAILWLLEVADVAVQASAQDLLSARLPTIKPARRGDISPAVIAVIERIRAALARGTAVDEAQLTALEVIVSSNFADEDLALSKTVPEILTLAASPSTPRSSRLVALEILRKLTYRLGPRLIPLVAKIVPFAVTILATEAQSASTSSSVVAGAFSVLEGVFSAIPTFIGTQADKVFAAMLSPELAALGDDAASSKARAALLSTAAKKLPAKTLYPAIIRLHGTVDSADKSGMLGLLDLLNRALRHGKAADIAENYRAIFKLFLSVFDLRRQPPASLDEDDVSEIEENALGAFVQFILKLSEQTFRPLFLRTYDWAVIDLAEEPNAEASLVARRTVLYKLMDRLLVQLKSIVVPYFSFMLDQTIELFESFAAGTLRDLPLWTAAASALTKALEYDESGFWTPLRLGKLGSPIATQLQSPDALSSATIATVFHPLLAEYAHALAPHETLLKKFNTSLLMLTRSDDLRVKRTALEALEKMWETLGDGMLGLVPETTPFLAETLEEVEGGVEATTRRLIKKIEEHLGETLDSYLE